MTPTNPKSSRQHLRLRNSSQSYRSRPPSGSIFQRKRAPIVLWGLLGIVLSGSLWLRFGTIQGVPAFIVLKFVTDRTALNAYFSGELRVLHDRLNQMGVEEDIKAYYRPQFSDEVELDWHIHQLLYDRTGYVGKAYKIGANQTLVLKTQADKVFPRWLALAKEAGLELSHREEDGIIYLDFPDGISVPYEQFSEIYSLKTLRQMIRQQKRYNQSMKQQL